MIVVFQFVRRFSLLLCAMGILGLQVSAEVDQPELESSLGLPIVLNDFYIAGSKAEPIPRIDSESSLVIRVLEVKPAADGFRYDLEIYGLDPGSYRLSDYFRYVGSNESLPQLSQQITIVTEHDLEGIPKPKELANVPPENVGGYRVLLTVCLVIWGVVFLLILFWRKKKVQSEEFLQPPPTLHEKLGNLVRAAAHGDLSDSDRSQLERLILGHWKQKLPEIENLPASEALVTLRSHPEASPLLLKLEYWLHAPNPSIDQQSINNLLDSFRDV